MTDNERIILGIDPGTNVMGYGVLKAVGNKAQLMALGVIDLRKMHDPYIRFSKGLRELSTNISPTRWL